MAQARSNARPLAPLQPLDNATVTEVYSRLALVYDWVFGVALQPGRLAATRAIPPGTSVLEVGVGTGINLPLYHPACRVTGIDLSEPMLDRAALRLASHRLTNVRLLHMDAANMAFPDASFDVVYAPYLISVVPDPVRVASEMRRVCRPNGRIQILNHFLSANGVVAWIERRLAPLAGYLGFNSALDLDRFLAESQLQPSEVDKVNYPGLWSLVTCAKPVNRGSTETREGAVLAPVGLDDARLHHPHQLD